MLTQLKKNARVSTCALLCWGVGMLHWNQEAGAVIINPERCEFDSLENDDTSAKGRNAWVKKCKPDSYEAYFPEGDEFQLDNKNVSTRRAYITFAVFDPTTKKFTAPGNWKAPKDPNASCSELPKGYRPVGICTGGCYAPSQKILFQRGWVPALEAHASHQDHLITLGKEASLERPTYQVSSVKNYTASLIDVHHDLLELRMASGGSLIVTDNHPLLDQNRKMREAAEFRQGDSLIRQDGSPDLILEIVGSSHYGKVYNLDVWSNDELENILVAEGYLNGSSYYQNADIQKLNQLLFRKWVVPASFN